MEVSSEGLATAFPKGDATRDPIAGPADDWIASIPIVGVGVIHVDSEPRLVPGGLGPLL